jgi:hypothetical protein
MIIDGNPGDARELEPLLRAAAAVNCASASCISCAVFRVSLERRDVGGRPAAAAVAARGKLPNSPTPAELRLLADLKMLVPLGAAGFFWESLERRLALPLLFRLRVWSKGPRCCTSSSASTPTGAVIGDVTGGSDIALGKVADVLGDSRAEGRKEPEGLPTEDAR